MNMPKIIALYFHDIRLAYLAKKVNSGKIAAARGFNFSVSAMSDQYFVA